MEAVRAAGPVLLALDARGLVISGAGALLLVIRAPGRGRDLLPVKYAKMLS